MRACVQVAACDDLSTEPLAAVLSAVAPTLASLRLQSIRVNDDIFAAPASALSLLTALTSLRVSYTPLATLAFLAPLARLRALHLVGTVPAISDPAEFGTHLRALSQLTLLEYDAGQEFDRAHVDPAVWTLGVDAGMLRGQLADALPALPQLEHLAFMTRDVEIEGDMDVAFVAGLSALQRLSTLRLDSSFSVATPGFAEWLRGATALRCLELMDVQTQSPEGCVRMHEALSALSQLTRLDLCWFGCPGAVEQTVAAFAGALVQLQVRAASSRAVLVLCWCYAHHAKTPFPDARVR